ncbi:MAG TPA: alkaline phosphatase PhoX [Cytophagaceae bacterium]|jgi:hypothetical protein
MKKIYLSVATLLGLSASVFAQFPASVDLPTLGATPPKTVVMPKSPLNHQVVFVGKVDTVATTAIPSKVGGNGQLIYGQSAGKQLAKEWHDFTGFTPATPAEISAWSAKGHQNFLGWVSINHELVLKDDKIGDGGGMTVFAVKRDPATDSLIVINQELADGRKGKFFNVDFVNTVGETGMNCGGITSSVDGRIWTAEEWFRSSNFGGKDRNDALKSDGSGIYFEGGSLLSGDPTGVRDTANFTIRTTEFPGTDYAGKEIKKFQNFNWMVEIDPRQAKALRKQYNWGRQGFEGGAIMPDNKTVYLGEDGVPGLFTKFVADVAGDFTKGRTFVYKHDNHGPSKWVEIDNTKLDTMLRISAVAMKKKVSMFNRLEWVTYNKTNGKVYMSETGRDDLRFSPSTGVVDNHWVSAYKNYYKQRKGVDFTGTDAAAKDSVYLGKFPDYYGRVLEYDPMTEVVTSYIEGGPFFAASPTAANYPAKHLTNPDGLNMLYVNGKTYMVICEDLNGRTMGRVPSEMVGDSKNNICELFLLDMAIANPTVNDLIKISATPYGGEVTGACPTPDGKTLLVNSQHPDGSNPFPYNHSLTYAISGWDKAIITASAAPEFAGSGFQIWPNPAARELHFNEKTDAAIYDTKGTRVKVYRDVQLINISDLNQGLYYISNKAGQLQKLVVE